MPDQRLIERTADDIVARVFSTSSTAPPLFGEHRADFERDMREVLAQASPAGRFSLRLPDNRLRIWRLPALSGPPYPHRFGERRADFEAAGIGPGAGDARDRFCPSRLLRI